MMKRRVLLGLGMILMVAASWGSGRVAERHAASGILVGVDRAHNSLMISCDAVAGYMDAMEMPFAVVDVTRFAALTPGTSLRFTIVKHGQRLYADDVRAVSGANFESEPMEAAGMTALEDTLDTSAARKIVATGEFVPDFMLTDQADRRVHLSDLRGKVVLLTFGYSRCPNPAYCFRLSNNLARVEKRFAKVAGRDLVLVTVAIDPEHDQGQTLREYAAVWHADPSTWHFLTGPLPEVKQVAGMFGMNFWRRDGLLTHSLHTVILDRDGRLVANLEGNQFTVQQLGDLVQAVLAERD